MGAARGSAGSAPTRAPAKTGAGGPARIPQTVPQYAWPIPYPLFGRGGLADATVGMALAIASVYLLGSQLGRPWLQDANLSRLLGYLIVWVPLAGAVVVACLVHGTWGARDARGARSRSLSLGRNLGLRFRPVDLVWGLSIGLLARAVSNGLEIVGYGRLESSLSLPDSPIHDPWWLFGMLLAPMLLAPFVEEVFFRGLLLRAIQGVRMQDGGGRGGSMSIAVLASAAVFALVHVLHVESGTQLLVVGVGAFVFGVGAGTVAILTGRLGGAIVAHVTFSALILAPALL